LIDAEQTNRWADGGVYLPAEQIPSPNHNQRPLDTKISLIVIHNISLPPCQFGGLGVQQLFSNQLDPNEHSYYAQIANIKVSAHFFIRRNGHLIQFVGCEDRAWHAGQSIWQGQSGCNDFSIGIELEGCDTQPFSEEQYSALLELVCNLSTEYPIDGIVGHEHIAPSRKTDPGPYFDWEILRRNFPNMALPPT
jgi:AmpD protein